MELICSFCVQLSDWKAPEPRHVTFSRPAITILEGQALCEECLVYEMRPFVNK